MTTSCPHYNLFVFAAEEEGELVVTLKGYQIQGFDVLEDHQWKYVCCCCCWCCCYATWEVLTFVCRRFSLLVQLVEHPDALIDWLLVLITLFVLCRSR